MSTEFSIQLGKKKISVEWGNPYDISIPLYFGGAQPNAYGVEKATSAPCEAGSLVGDTRRGGSCNFERYQLIPHCNGTHTESVGHITHERISIRECLKDAFSYAVLVTIEPEIASRCGESYPYEPDEKDKLITRRKIERALESATAVISDFNTGEVPKSLIIRTMPNDDSKLTRTYLETIPPYFSTEAIEYLSEIDIKHLLVDLPSIDRIFDDGRLSNHRIFWNVEQGSFEKKAGTRVGNTITELIYVPAKIADGEYLLNLQIAPFASDASPSRPILFEFSELPE